MLLHLRKHDEMTVKYSTVWKWDVTKQAAKGFIGHKHYKIFRRDNSYYNTQQRIKKHTTEITSGKCKLFVVRFLWFLLLHSTIKCSKMFCDFYPNWKWLFTMRFKKILIQLLHAKKVIKINMTWSLESQCMFNLKISRLHIIWERLAKPWRV